MVEITKANRTIEFVNLSLFDLFFSVTNWKLLNTFNLTFLKISLNSNFIFFFEFIMILSSYFFKDSVLFFDFSIVEFGLVKIARVAIVVNSGIMAVLKIIVKITCI